MRVELAALPPAVIDDGEKEQVTPAGSPEHERLIGVLNPPEVLAPIVTAVEPPRITLAEGADSASVKSAAAAAVGTSVANNPLV